VEQDCAGQADLEKPDDRVVVRVNDLVVQARPEPDERRVGDVNEQEEENGDAGDPVERPRPLALATPINGPEALGNTCHTGPFLPKKLGAYSGNRV
jgi:hypothetical protein